MPAPSSTPCSIPGSALRLVGAGIALAVVVAPALARAAGPTVLDFASPGPLRTYLDLAMGVARSYLAFALLLAVALEALGHVPGRPRDLAAVAWRFIVVLFLLASYERVFGFVLTTTEEIADRLTPADALAEHSRYLDTVYGRTTTDTGVDAAVSGAASGAVSGATAAPAGAGEARPAGRGFSFSNALFDALMAIVLFLGEALVYGLDRLARILTAVFFILGPLALVAGIPRQSATGSRWFTHFVTIACWPIFAGVLLGVMTAVAKASGGKSAGTYLGSLVTAVVMGLCALAAPLLSAWIIGGATQNAAGVGHATAMNLAQSVRRWKATVTPGRNTRAHGGSSQTSGARASGTQTPAPPRTRGGPGKPLSNPPSP